VLSFPIRETSSLYWKIYRSQICICIALSGINKLYLPLLHEFNMGPLARITFVKILCGTNIMQIVEPWVSGTSSWQASSGQSQIWCMEFACFSHQSVVPIAWPDDTYLSVKQWGHIKGPFAIGLLSISTSIIV
jgi:hypothetical protein